MEVTLIAACRAIVHQSPRVTTRSCHCDHNNVEVTGVARAVHQALGAPVHLVTPPGGSGDGASCRSSSAGGGASSRGAVVRVVRRRGRLSPS